MITSHLGRGLNMIAGSIIRLWDLAPGFTVTGVGVVVAAKGVTVTVLMEPMVWEGEKETSQNAERKKACIN